MGMHARTCRPRRMSGAGRVLGAGAALAIVLIFAGCSSHEEPAAAAGKPHAAATLRKVPPASVIPPNMVTAVSGTRTAPAGVQVKVDLRERPQVASPLAIALVIVPPARNVDRRPGKGA